MAIALIGPRHLGFRQQFIVHVERIHSLIEKTEQSIYGRASGQRIAVAPHDVFENLLAYPGRPVGRLTFVRDNEWRSQ